MAKRLADTDKYKKKFIRSLPGAYKLLWDYICLDCNHAGIWEVDFEVAQLRLGADMLVNEQKAIELFNAEEEKIVVLNGGSKWFIRPFIDFQYGNLDPNNRVHFSVLRLLKEEGIKGLTRPLQGAINKDKDKDKDKDMDKGGLGGEIKPKTKPKYDLPEMIITEFKESYLNCRGVDYITTNHGKERSAAGKLIRMMKNKEQGLNTNQIIQGMRDYFDQAVAINDPWLFTNMSLPIIVSKINEINTILRNGNKRPNSQAGATDRELAELLASKWANK